MPCRHALAMSVLLFAAAVSNEAGAAAQRTFVASTGNDANPCSLAKPCRGFAAAVGMTNPGGEVIVLDSAGYGPVTITQSVSIVAPLGVYAGISVFAPDSGDSDKIMLRGLSITGQGGLHGIVVNSAAEVHVENCIVTNMTGTGIFILVTAGSAIEILNTSVQSNGEAGLWVSGGAPSIHLVDSQFALNGYVPLLGGPKPGINLNAGTLNAQRIVAYGNA